MLDILQQHFCAGDTDAGGTKFGKSQRFADWIQLALVRIITDYRRRAVWIIRIVLRQLEAQEQSNALVIDPTRARDIDFLVEIGHR